MADARIFQKIKDSTQSGRSGLDQWVLEFLSREPSAADPLTGWNGRAETRAQVKLTFPTLEAAKAYAEKKGISVTIVPAPQPKLKLQAYADNFR